MGAIHSTELELCDARLSHRSDLLMTRGRCDNGIWPSESLMWPYLGQHRGWNEDESPAWCCNSCPAILRLACVLVHLCSSVWSSIKWATTGAASRLRIASLVPSFAYDRSS